MSLVNRICLSNCGNHVLDFPGLGEVHLEYSSRPEAGHNSTLWEGMVHCKDKEHDSLCTVLHVITDSPEDLLYQLDRALFVMPEPT